MAQVGDLHDDVQMAMQARRRMHRATVVLIMSLSSDALLPSTYSMFLGTHLYSKIQYFLGRQPLFSGISCHTKFPFKEFLPLIFPPDVGFLGR